MGIALYEIDSAYINYLSMYAPHLFLNNHTKQRQERKYIGILLTIDNIHYFAPISSFKSKHTNMKENIDFIKIKKYAVINLNNMFPTPEQVFTRVDIGKQTDPHYKALLQAEYRIIKVLQNKICKNAHILYTHKLQYGISTPLARRCNDFKLLEKACMNYFK